ncbi:hypothetical protein [Flavobacterium sp. K5-23]|uniref:hypothetical protein n=1 Tax=Flavobacterium sp. K5-23 TaxID=2746225 RepID=UPI00200D5A40|nr:hypothetical protein [Flavobacterium sp. K5-23]UQD55181.1 hypothetical protein FLAK523_01765 [Flavobacterium sp. K5-23]
MINNLLIEIRKDIFFKSKKYSLVVDGINQGVLTYSNSKRFLSLEPGKHIVSIQCDDYLVENEIVIKTDTLKRYYIKPNVSLQLYKGISIGFLLFSVCIFSYSFLDPNNKISVPIFLILLFTFIFRRFYEKSNANFIIQK